MSGDNSKGVATWKLLLMAASLFVYQNLDNLDGKQARRTSNWDLIQIQAAPWECYLITELTQWLLS
jgi:hypothetical protein